VDATGCGHITVSLAKPDHPAVARPTQKQKIGTIGLRVVTRFDSLILLDLLAMRGRVPPVCVVPLQLFWIVAKRLPDFDQWFEAIRPHAPPRCQRAKHSSASQEWFSVDFEHFGEIGNNFTGEAMFVPDPFE